MSYKKDKAAKQDGLAARGMINHRVAMARFWRKPWTSSKPGSTFLCE
jgi:hypothetical protein